MLGLINSIDIVKFISLDIIIPKLDLTKYRI